MTILNLMIIMNLYNINGGGRYPKINKPDLKWDNERKAYFSVTYCKIGDKVISKDTTWHSPDQVTMSSKISCWFNRIFH